MSDTSSGRKGPAHIGKMPSRAKLGAELSGLAAELKRAVETEDYEQAARLRDRIHSLRTPAEGQGQ